MARFVEGVVSAIPYVPGNRAHLAWISSSNVGPYMDSPPVPSPDSASKTTKLLYTGLLVFVDAFGCRHFGMVGVRMGAKLNYSWTLGMVGMVIQVLGRGGRVTSGLYHITRAAHCIQNALLIALNM